MRGGGEGKGQSKGEGEKERNGEGEGKLQLQISGGYFSFLFCLMQFHVGCQPMNAWLLFWKLPWGRPLYWPTVIKRQPELQRIPAKDRS